MPTPRRRQASTLSDWPQLSLLAVYADEPVFDAGERATALSDEALEAAKVLYFATPLEAQPYDAARRNRAMGTILGVSSFARTLSPDEAARIRSVRSNKRRMLWVEAEPGFHLHATIRCPRSTRHPRRASTGTDASEGSKEDSPASLAEDEVLLASLRQAYSEFRLRFGTIQGALEAEGKEAAMGKLRKFWDVWTRDWETSMLESQVERLLQAVPKSAILSIEAAAQLGPLLAQFAASNSSALPILLHGDTVLSIPRLPPPSADQPPPAPGRPPPPPLSQDDLLSLVRYLDRLLPPKRTLMVVSDAKDASSASSAGEDSAGSGRWSSLTAGMNSFLAPRPFSLAMPALPGMASSTESEKVSSKPATLRAGFAALRRTEQQEVAKRQQETGTSANDAHSLGNGTSTASLKAPNAKGSRWSLRNVSWGALGFGSSETDSVDELSAPTEPSTSKSSVNAGQKSPAGRDSGNDQAAAATSPLATDPPASSTDDALKPSTPAVELAPSVDASELADAIGRTPTEEDQPVVVAELAVPGLEVRSQVSEQEPEDPDSEEGERPSAVRLFCGEGDYRDTLFEARLYERGALRLALAILPATDNAALAWLDGRAERLLEAVESLLEIVVPPKPRYPHRHLVKHDLLVNSVSQTGSTATASADADAELALVDSYVAMHAHPRALESVTRLSSSRWSLHRRFSVPLAPNAETGPSAVDTTDIFAILPSKAANGKDLSLIDAADELRRIERAYLRKA
ncbi:hypothetical protein NBRC10512_007730 [Rhodotorula toruloides]|uniref:RHTO0S01e16072g1_1 n=2 Tax=Rhodotorula toruloides TaxID=5286 RepID=A0A061AN65_RHOTO|nr:uncharacterized protein RHTO_04145 [Rhodotorula toruloides NP11]EMS19610.1 hypothetical protein RHTO_04145 [Rhodotorula toruloides NP11]CDR36183.1 RHTO0S01e16072g1_1 [Rhodotorula toruloides]